MQFIADAVANLVGEFPAAAGTKKRLQASGMLTKEQLLAFFKAGRELLDRAAVKDELEQEHARGGDAQELVTNMQKAIFETQGVQGDFGIGCLQRVADEYSGDKEFMKDFYSFVARSASRLVVDLASARDCQTVGVQWRVVRAQGGAGTGRSRAVARCAGSEIRICCSYGSEGMLLQCRSTPAVLIKSG